MSGSVIALIVFYSLLWNVLASSLLKYFRAAARMHWEGIRHPENTFNIPSIELALAVTLKSKLK